MNIFDIYNKYSDIKEKESEEGKILIVYDYEDSGAEMKLDEKGIVREIKIEGYVNGPIDYDYAKTEFYDEEGNKIGNHYKDYYREIKYGKNGEILYYKKGFADSYDNDYEIYEKKENGEFIYHIKATAGLNYVSSEVIITEATIFETDFYDRETGEKISEEEFTAKYPEYNLESFYKTYPQYKYLRKIQLEKEQNQSSKQFRDENSKDNRIYNKDMIELYKRLEEMKEKKNELQESMRDLEDQTTKAQELLKLYENQLNGRESNESSIEYDEE